MINSDTGGVSFHDTGGVAFHGRLRIAICGHVDTRGAPTGRLIFELQSLSECALVSDTVGLSNQGISSQVARDMHKMQGLYGP